MPGMIVRDLPPKLLEWYHRHGRSLPWRGETDAYKIWLSEVMLQQTQVKTALPYYRRFVARFPTLTSLAAASQDEVLKAWEGLGYYARARNLHRAAQEVVARHGGQLPHTYRALKQLPGFGEYTAGAVAAIAFGERVAAVDGNVKRVISRLFAIQEDVSRGEGLRRVKTIAAELAGAAPNPADWTQALIEFGATVCTPARPHCALCPAARGLCRAEQLGLAQSLPVKRRKKPIPHYTVTAAVIFKNSARTRFLITQRPPDGLLGGLWEFPGGKQEPGETLPACLRREIKEELAIDIAVAEPVAVVKHTFSHFKITLHAFAATLVAGRPQKIGVTDWAWVTPADLDRFAFGRADRKVIEALYRAGVKSGRAD